MTDQTDQAAMPALVVEEALAWGASPDGAEVVLIVQSASQGPCRLAMSSKVLADLITAAQAAKMQAGKNAQVAGEDMVAAVPVNSFKVASLAGGKMTMLFIDPNQLTEVAYAITDPAAAIEMGRMLVAEGMKAKRIGDAISGKAPDLAMPRPPRIIRPN